MRAKNTPGELIKGEQPVELTGFLTLGCVLKNVIGHLHQTSGASWACRRDRTKYRAACGSAGG